MREDALVDAILELSEAETQLRESNVALRRGELDRVAGLLVSLGARLASAKVLLQEVAD
jgi:hypothetical protein